MKKARFFGNDHIILDGTIIHIESLTFAHKDWMERNGLEKTETVETETGNRFAIYANYARCLACAVPVLFHSELTA